MKWNEIGGWVDVATWHGMHPEQMPEVGWMPPFMRRPMVLFYKMGMLNKAINGDWEPDYTNTDQKKHYVWCQLVKDDSRAAGFRLSFSDCVYDRAVADLGARLVFETPEKAKHALKIMEAEHEEWLFGIRNDIRKPMTIYVAPGVNDVMNTRMVKVLQDMGHVVVYNGIENTLEGIDNADCCVLLMQPKMKSLIAASYMKGKGIDVYAYAPAGLYEDVPFEYKMVLKGENDLKEVFKLEL